MIAWYSRDRSSLSASISCWRVTLGSAGSGMASSPWARQRETRQREIDQDGPPRRAILMMSSKASEELLLLLGTRRRNAGRALVGAVAVVDDPRRLVAVVLVAGRRLQRILGLVEREIPLVVFFLGLHGIERHGDILLAHAEKAADADDQRRYLALLVEQYIVDRADLGLLGVVDGLLVEIGDG